MPPSTRWPFSEMSPAARASARKASSKASSCRKNGTFIRDRAAGATSLR